MLVAPPAAKPAAEASAKTAGDWRPVMGASVRFLPIDRRMVRRARRAAAKAMGGEVAGLADDAEQIEALGDAFSRELLLEGVAEWRDVVIDVEEGGVVTSAPLPCTRENLDRLLSDPLIFDAFDDAYVVPYVTRERERAAPGNGSAGSPSGTGGPATQASDTASTAAALSKPADATRARTSQPKRKPRQKRASGKS